MAGGGGEAGGMVSRKRAARREPNLIVLSLLLSLCIIVVFLFAVYRRDAYDPRFEKDIKAFVRGTDVVLGSNRVEMEEEAILEVRRLKTVKPRGDEPGYFETSIVYGHQGQRYLITARVTFIERPAGPEATDFIVDDVKPMP